MVAVAGNPGVPVGQPFLAPYRADAEYSGASYFSDTRILSMRLSGMSQMNATET